MPDDLRTRIADCCGVTSVDLTDSDRYAVADAVIRELGMREERWKSDDPTMLRGHWTRFVTDWSHPDA